MKLWRKIGSLTLACLMVCGLLFGTAMAEGWDGTFHGKPVKEGVYFLLAKAKGADGTEYTIRKDVNLLRGYNKNVNE